MLLATRGLRNMDSGIERIDDADEAAQIRRQARRVMVKAALFAIGLTALTLLPAPAGG